MGGSNGDSDGGLSERGARSGSWQGRQGEFEPALILRLRGQSLILGPVGPMKPPFQLLLNGQSVPPEAAQAPSLYRSPS